MAYTPQTTGVITTPKQYNTSPSSWDPAYGGIPNLPLYTTDTTQQAGTDVAAQLAANLPQYQAMMNTASGATMANLKGEVAPDVAANLGTRAAEFGVGSGMPMSPASATGFLARYGLTSNALQQQGMQQMGQMIQQTPIQQTSTGQSTQDMAAQRAVYASAPQPAAAAAAALQQTQAGMGMGRGATGPGNIAPSIATQAPTANMGYGGLDANTLSAMNATFADTDQSRAFSASQAFDPLAPYTGADDGFEEWASQYDDYTPANNYDPFQDLGYNLNP